MPASALIAENKKEGQDDGESHESMGVVKGQCRVERELEPEGQRRRTRNWRGAFTRIGRWDGGGFQIVRKKPGPPLIKKQQSCRQGVKQTSLGNEHRQRETLPRYLVNPLVVLEYKSLKNRDARYPAIEEESCDPKTAGPAVKGITGRGRSQQRGPDEAPCYFDTEAGKNPIEKVDPGRIPHLAERMDRVIGPKRNPAGKLLYVGEVKGQITEVVRRLYFQLVIVVVEQPAKGTDRKGGKTKGQDPKPDRAISFPRRNNHLDLFRPALASSFPAGRLDGWRRGAFDWTRTQRNIISPKVGQKGGDKSGKDRDPRDRPRQATRDQTDQKSGDRCAIEKSNPGGQ